MMFLLWLLKKETLLRFLSFITWTCTVFVHQHKGWLNRVLRSYVSTIYRKLNIRDFIFQHLCNDTQPTNMFYTYTSDITRITNSDSSCIYIIHATSVLMFCAKLQSDWAWVNRMDSCLTLNGDILLIYYLNSSRLYFSGKSFQVSMNCVKRFQNSEVFYLFGIESDRKLLHMYFHVRLILIFLNIMCSYYIQKPFTRIFQKKIVFVIYRQWNIYVDRAYF